MKDKKMAGREDLNPQPPDLESGDSGLQEVVPQSVTDVLSAACTTACTRDADSGPDDPSLNRVMAAWPSLPLAIKTGVLAMVEAATIWPAESPNQDERFDE